MVRDCKSRIDTRLSNSRDSDSNEVIGSGLKK